MKILVVHNFYQEPGGEDSVVAAEERILIEHGHGVIRYRRHNDELQNARPWRTALAGIETTWAMKPHRELTQLILSERPDIAHFHNTFPLISPSSYYACHDARVPIVQTLHNYRLLCPAATFFREGRVCEECLGRNVAWPGIMHGCYRGSWTATGAISGMLAFHRALHTWTQKVDLYIALSEFARKQFIAGNLPADRIVVKHNFVCTPPAAQDHEESYAIYMGRLSEEKGIRVLLEAWGRLSSGAPLKVAGDGPLRDEMLSNLANHKSRDLDYLGQIPPQNVFQQLRGARFLVFPSVCFENFPLAIVEAFACGVPVIASAMGAMKEIVADGKTGLHFTPGDAADLAAKVDWAWTHPTEMKAMGRAARAEYESKYTAENNYLQLMAIYDRAISAKSKIDHCANSSRSVAA